MRSSQGGSRPGREQIRFGGFAIGLQSRSSLPGRFGNAFKPPLTPIADPDTWGYLSPALRKLTCADFGHTQGRNFLYPGFLYLVLRSFGDFRAIAIVQHLLGVAAGGVLLLTWRRLPCLCPRLVSQSFAS
ncbi:MAG: hypothetical protein DME37_12690 [Verrucomicrobia bacterium]|nr:MAG: hypothetical protein DME37_12690 [Verrucomicrobiota bacterium]PYM09766.1 MAG: hypothetical protein DMF15_04460 [Verrucomicrobiota bacterium]